MITKLPRTLKICNPMTCKNFVGQEEIHEESSCIDLRLPLTKCGKKFPNFVLLLFTGNWKVSVAFNF